MIWAGICHCNLAAGPLHTWKIKGLAGRAWIARNCEPFRQARVVCINPRILFLAHTQATSALNADDSNTYWRPCMNMPPCILLHNARQGNLEKVLPQMDLQMDVDYTDDVCCHVRRWRRVVLFLIVTLFVLQPICTHVHNSLGRQTNSWIRNVEVAMKIKQFRYVELPPLEKFLAILYNSCNTESKA